MDSRSILSLFLAFFLLSPCFAAGFSVSITSPLNGTYTKDTTPLYNFAVNGDFASYNCTLFYDGSAYGSNDSVANAADSTILTNATITDGYYLVNITCNNDTTINTTQANITIDAAPPQISITSPTNNTQINRTLLDIIYTVAESNMNITNISIINASGSIVNSTTNISTGTVHSYLSAYNDGVYGINTTTFDKAGNTNSTTISNVTIFTSDIIGIRPVWSSTTHQGNSTLSAGGSETTNTSRRLYCNFNQTKTLQFYVNNSGFQAAQNLTVQMTGFAGLTTNLIWANGTDASLPIALAVNASALLNLTIACPSSQATYIGEIYALSSNGGNYNYANLSLGINATSQTLPRLNNSGSTYYFSSNNQTNIGFYVYLYDNQTIDGQWSGIYNINVTDGTNVTPLNFSVSNGLFYSALNTTGLSEGTYNLTGTFSDAANNEVSLNIPFNLFQDVGMNASAVNEDLIGKNSNFTFRVTVSKNGTSSGSGTICIAVPSTITYYGSACIATTPSSGGSTVSWTLMGSSAGSHIINATFNTSDGRFNKTIQKTILVRYGSLSVSLYSSFPPSQVETSEDFNVKADVVNNGDLTATNVNLHLDFDTDYFTLLSTSQDCDRGEITEGSTKTCTWSLEAKISAVSATSITVSISSGVHNATINSSASRDVRIVAATQPQDSGQGTQTTTTTTLNSSQSSSSLSFTKPLISALTLSQGQNYILPVSVKNTGQGTLTNLYISLSGIDSSAFSISSNDKSSLASGNSRDFNINFSIPAIMAAKSYNLIIKAMPEQGSWTKTLQLVIIGKGIDVSGLENISIIQGQNKTFSFVVRSTGNSALTNASLSLENIDAGKYSFDPQAFPTISSGAGQGGKLSISASNDEEIGDKTIVLSANAIEGNFTYVFKVTILPSEEGKQNLTRQYEDLSLRLAEMLKKYSGTDKGKVNVTEIESEINATNNTLFLVNKSLSNGDYAQAQSLIYEAKTSMSLLESKIPSASGNGNGPQALFMAGAFAFGLLLVVIALVYSFAPRKKYVPSKLILDPTKEPQKEPSKEQGKGIQKELDKEPVKETKSKGIFSRLNFRKRNESTREKIVEEWLKRYELSKKKNPYGG